MKKFNFYFQVLLEFDKMSWKEREWYSVYEENAVLNSSSEVNIFFIYQNNRRYYKKKNLQEKKKDKNVEKGTKRKRRKTDLDSEEEVEEFQIFCIEDKLTVAHRPNSQGSSATTGTLYPALVQIQIRNPC